MSSASPLLVNSLMTGAHFWNITFRRKVLFIWGFVCVEACRRLNRLQENLMSPCAMDLEERFTAHHL
eukprot:9749729-Karenia_brevis.AAC.1